VHELLADPATAYVLVTSARPDAIAEASFFASKLAEREVAVAALVVNRIAPSFGLDDGGSEVPPALAEVGALQALEANLAELNAVAAREASGYADLATQVSPAPVGLIPLFGHDVHELAGLERAADCLFG
jgi:hypothetical protein